MLDPETQLLRDMLNGITGDPDSFELVTIPHQNGVIWEVKPRPDVAGRVLGKNGDTIGSIRRILSSILGRQRKSMQLNLLGVDASHT